MTLNDAYQDTEPPDHSLTPVTAIFRQPELETRFRQHTLAQTQKQLRASLIFGAAFEVSFWLTDIAALGYNSTTQILLLARLLVGVTVAGCLYLLAKHPQSLAMPWRTATLAEIVGMSAFLLVILHRPGEMPWHGMSMGTILIVFYIFIPNTFLNATLVALASSVAFITLALQIGTLTQSDVITMVLLLTFTNVFGILAAHRHANLSRQQFLALTIERQALATQRLFVSMVSHEFLTPLAIIDTVAQRLGFSLELRQPELAPRVGKIRRAVARLLNLLDNCLTEDRLAAADLVLQAEPVDLRESILFSYSEPGAQSSPRLHLHLPKTPQWAHCDRHLVDITLSNLVNNALKYSPEDTPVIIRLEPDALPGKIVIRIEDQGPGIPPADREQIFDKFFRCNGSQAPGAGLGLHLARDLARRHGGDVTLAPESEHTGAIFTLSLPRSRPSAAAA